MTVLDRIKAAFKQKDESALNAALAELPESGAAVVHTHVHVRDEREDKEEEKEEEKEKKTRDRVMDAFDKRLEKVEDAVSDIAADVKSIKDAKKDEEEEEEEEFKKSEEVTKDEEIEFEAEAPPGTGDSAWKGIKDSKPFETGFQETVALAEIICPGIQVPTFDAKSKPGKTVNQICQFRRRTLDVAYGAQPETKAFIDELLSGHDLKTRKCGDVRTLFQAVGVFKKNQNNQAMTSRTTDSFNPGTKASAGGSKLSAAEVNKRNAEFYKSH